MISGNVSNVYCPGCGPGDFAMPHICGIGQTTTPQVISGFQIAPPSPPIPCDHCFCLKLKAGWHDVPSPTLTWAGRTVTKHLKPHQVCCNCGNRRVKEADANA